MVDEPAQPEFPEKLALIPDRQKIPQRFGWALATWAFGLLLFSSIIFVQPAKPEKGEYIGSAISAMAAVLLVVFEIRRRKRQAFLVRPETGNVVGIYRRGLLARTLEVAHVGIFLRHPANTWGPILGLSGTALMFALFAAPGPADISVTDHFLALFASLTFAAFAASVIYVRLFCEELLFPHNKQRRVERILVRRKAIKMLLSRR